MTDRMSLTLAQADPEVAAAVDHETLRQHEGLEMIASENFVSEAVLEAAGSTFTNKYAEGYPDPRPMPRPMPPSSSPATPFSDSTLPTAAT